MENRTSGNFHISKDENVSEDRNLKLDDENSLSTMEDNLINRSVNVTHFSLKCVRFVPNIIEFVDAFEGKQFSVKLMIQNIGRDPILIKLGEPNSFIFQLKKTTRRKKFLAAGSSITGTVSYTYHNDDLVQSSQIPVQINSRMVYYPIIVKKAVPLIEVDPKNLHFKIIDLGASAKTMILNIYNVGGKRTKFEVDVGKNLLDLVVRPLRGTVKAKDSVKVFVEIMGLREGEYYQEFWIKTNETPIRIPVFVEVVRPRLQIIFPNGTEDLTLIDFPPTFNGAQRMNSFVLKNCSTETTMYITLAEVDGTLQLLKNARETSDSFSLFMLTAEEGRLEPFENRILNILFRPKTTVKTKGWHHQQSDNKKLRVREIIVFFRIKRVHCLEHKELAKIEQSPTLFKIDKDGDLGLKHNFPEKENEVTEFKDFLRLCVHGQAVEPDITIQPTDFDFGTLYLGETRDKVLRVTNNSVIPVKCKLEKVLNVKTTPKEIWLQREKGKEFLIRLTPKCAGNFKTKMKVEILAESDVPCKKKVVETVAVYIVSFSYVAVDVQTPPPPKIGLGITPLITDDVGLQKESITFKNVFDLPFAAVLDLKRGFQPLWMKKEQDWVNNVKNALVALPNDRPRMFYTWPEEKICRTIFKGFFRYSPPADLAYTLTSEGRIEKKERSALWTDYIKTLKQMKKKNSFQQFLKIEFVKFFQDPHSPADLDEEIERLTEVLHKCSKKSNRALKTPLVPLSPLILYNVSVDPKLINFGTVAVGTRAQEIITIKNMNQFSVGVKFEASQSAVSVLEEGTIDILPLSTKLVHILFQSNELGRYFGFLNYIINGSHQFKISISASVTTKTVTIPDSFTSLEFGKYSPKDPFQPRSMYLPLKNFLQAPVKYKWDFSLDSAFSTDIIKGEIPPRSTILTEIIFNLSPKKSFYSEVIFTSENVTKEIIKLSHPHKKVAVDFLSSRIDMHEIPLNLPTKAKALVLNASYHDVSFEVITPNPIPGVKIEPILGTIKPRSYFPLDISVQIPVIMKFSFDVVLLVHFVNKISMKISGNVVLPNIRMRPSEVLMRKICAQSFDTFSVCVENIGKTPAELAIDFRSCPEFSVADEQSKIYLMPGKSVKVIVNFEPSDVARYVFYLPVIINNILGPPIIQERESENVNYYLSVYESFYKNFGEVIFSSNYKLKIPCVCLNSTVSSSLITVSPLQINFQQESSLDFGFQPKIIEISNQYVDEVIFCIRNDDLNEVNDSPFNLTPVVPASVEYRSRSLKVRLGRGEKLLLRATFNPKKPGNYSIQVPLFVKGYSKGLVYNYIRLSGKLKPPRIYTNITEVHFPPQPLGISFEVVLTVYAENHRINDFISSMICESQDGTKYDALMAQWLKEPHVTQHNTSFDLLIRFQSSAPIALRTYIALLSSTGVYTTVLVTATADNSSLTNHAFLTLYSSYYKLVKEVPGNLIGTNEDAVHVDNSVLKTLVKTPKKEKTVGGNMSDESIRINTDTPGDLQKSEVLLPVEKGPRLVMKMSKSMSGSQSSRAIKTDQTELRKKNNSSSVLVQDKTDTLTYDTPDQSDVFKDSKTYSNHTKQTSTPIDEVTYPNFPSHDGFCKKYFQKTLAYVERWIFEVVMRCDHYYSIPSSFQRLNELPPAPKVGTIKKGGESTYEKDFWDFLEEVLGKERSLPERKLIDPKLSLTEKANITRSFFAEVLKYLENKGCLLPHVEPEILMDYEYYTAYRESIENVDYLTCKILEVENPNQGRIPEPAKSKAEKDMLASQTSSLFLSKDVWKKNFFESFLLTSETEVEKLDEVTTDISRQRVESTREVSMEFERPKLKLNKTVFELRSTQAWFDVIIQMFKIMVLKKITSKNTIPHVVAVDVNEKVPVHSGDLNAVYNYNKKYKGIAAPPCVDSLSSNIYTAQERTLLVWLNYHFQSQTKVIWNSKHDCLFRGKSLLNFDKDLSDSIALIAVTAAYCPYIVSNYFQDVFPKPESPNMMHHNAGKLIQAWRDLSIGLTVENSDIVRPNPVFMVMLITHLYEVLPSLHPHTLISFSAPLNSEKSRVVQLKNESLHSLLYQAKFFGEHEGYFRLSHGPLVELKPSKTMSFNVTFSARKIKKITATLVLCGIVASPNFAKHLTFFLEGKPSELPEYDKFSFSAPLYKMICTDIPVKPPYPEKDTYAIWYTTIQPTYTDDEDISTIFKPWSKIWHRKISRRLFLGDSQVVIPKDKNVASLRVATACFTNQSRHFWLLFRSNTSDFILLFEIKAKKLETRTSINCFHSENWSPSAICTCVGENKVKMKESGCPFLTEFKISTRNEALWEGLRTMFLKAMHPQEKSFWVEHFETNIGINLILWMLPPDEEPEIIDEFVPVLSTKVTYLLTAENNGNFVTIPPKIEIPDVRERSEVTVPMHVSKEAPHEFTFHLTMTSENEKEVRTFKVKVQTLEADAKKKCDTEESAVMGFACRSSGAKELNFCVQDGRKKTSKSKTNLCNF